MPYPLQALQEMVYQTLRPAQMLQNGRPEQVWQKANSVLQQLPGQMLQAICMAANNTDQQSMLLAWRISIINFSNCLHSYILLLNTLPLDKESKQSYTTTYTLFRNQLYQSLQVLQHFPDNTGIELPLPDHVSEMEITSLQTYMQEIERTWKSKLSAVLLSILLYPFQQACSGDKTVSQRMVRYLRQLHNQLYILANQGLAKPETALLHLLIRLNFNSEEFVNYVLEKSQQNAPVTNHATLLQTYREERMRIKRIPVMDQAGLLPHKPSCQQILLMRLDEEIQWLHTLQTNGSTREEANNKSVQQPLLSSCLTGAQLAVLLRWCQQTGLLRSHNHRQLWKLMAATIQTAGGKPCKANSLQTEYYELDAAAISGAREGIIRLLNQSRSN